MVAETAILLRRKEYESTDFAICISICLQFVLYRRLFSALWLPRGHVQTSLYLARSYTLLRFDGLCAYLRQVCPSTLNYFPMKPMSLEHLVPRSGLRRQEHRGPHPIEPSLWLSHVRYA